MNRPLLAWPLGELEAHLVELGGRPFHARVARRELLSRGVTDYGAMGALPVPLRQTLARQVPLLAAREVRRTQARDRTVKLLLAFPHPDSVGPDSVGPDGVGPDGEGPHGGLPPAPSGVETVYIPPRRAAGGKGATLCVSTQAGCPVGCPFCASGLAGLERNLEAHEIVEQFVHGRTLGPLSRGVVMGIGEPLLNLENVTAALETVSSEMGIGARRLTVSTVGFPDRLRRAAEARPHFQLAISLHTADDDQRDELVPAMRGVPIDDILAAGDEWFARTGREVTYEIVLMAGENDTPGHAVRLARRLAGRRATVNLIPYNPTRGLPYQRPEPAVVEAFRERLEAEGLVATVRWSRGLDGAAACGQLRLAGPRVAQKRQV